MEGRTWAIIVTLAFAVSGLAVWIGHRITKGYSDLREDLKRKDDIIKQIAQDKKDELAVKDAELKELNERMISELTKAHEKFEALQREFMEE